MSTFSFTNGDDLSDFLGGAPATVQAAPRELPADMAHLRAMADQGPAAPSFKVPCKKCGGSGRFVSYSGRAVGPCYTCKGKGSFERKTSPVKLAAAKVAREDRKVRQGAQNVELVRELHPAELAWLEKTAAQVRTDRNGGFLDVVRSALEAVHKYGELSPGRLAMAQKGLARDQQRVAQKAQEAVQQQERVAGVDVANLADCFQRAQEAGLKRFTLRFNGLHLQTDRSDRNLVWASASGYGSAKYGLLKVAEGTFRPGRDATDAVLAHLAEVSKDPMAAAKAYVQVTNECSVCGRHLENQDSVDAGIGPVCAGRLNRPGLKFVEVKAGDF